VHVPVLHRAVRAARGGARRCVLRHQHAALETFNALQTPPGAYVTLIGSNHYGNADVDNPPGAAADASAPTLDQAVGVETVGRFSGNFLRAWVLDDAEAQAYVGGPTGDPNVLVMLLE
jgi:hypothetical protein